MQRHAGKEVHRLDTGRGEGMIMCTRHQCEEVVLIIVALQVVGSHEWRDSDCDVPA